MTVTSTARFPATRHSIFSRKLQLDRKLVFVQDKMRLAIDPQDVEIVDPSFLSQEDWVLARPSLVLERIADTQKMRVTVMLSRSNLMSRLAEPQSIGHLNTREPSDGISPAHVEIGGQRA